MDLTNQPVINVELNLDPDTNLVTIALSDDAHTPIDTIVIENSKYRAFMEAMSQVAREHVTSLMPQSKRRMTYNAENKVARIVFG